MPRVKIQLADNIKRVVTVDTDATRGAVVGSDLYLNGAVATPATFAQWLGLNPGNAADIRNGYGILISGTNPKTVSVNRAADFSWQGAHFWNAGASMSTDTSIQVAVSDDFGYRLFGREIPGLPVPFFTPLNNNTAIAFDIFPRGTPSDFSVNTGVAWFDICATDIVNDGTNYECLRLGIFGSGGDAHVSHARGGTGTVRNLRLQINGGQILIPNGTAALPPIAPLSDPNSGLYSGGADVIGISTGGVARLGVTNNNIVGTVPFRAPDGTAGAPSFSFSSDTDNGLYYIGANSFGLSVGGTVRLTFDTTAFTATLPWRGQNGSNTAPAFSFSGDNNTGMYNVGADQLGLATNSTLRLTVSTTLFTATLPWVGPAGAVGAPTFSFSGDSNTGVYSVGADQLGMAANGVLVGQFDSNATAGNTRFLVYDVDNATLERVSVGAADSGGTGFKVLRIPN